MLMPMMVVFMIVRFLMPMPMAVPVTVSMSMPVSSFKERV